MTDNEHDVVREVFFKWLGDREESSNELHDYEGLLKVFRAGYAAYESHLQDTLVIMQDDFKILQSQLDQLTSEREGLKEWLDNFMNDTNWHPMYRNCAMMLKEKLTQSALAVDDKGGM